jgi:hypothetical protein
MNVVSVEEESGEWPAIESAEGAPASPVERECSQEAFLEDTGLSDIRRLAVALGLIEADDFALWEQE